MGLTDRPTEVVALAERFDSLIAYVKTWGNAGDGFIETLEDVRAALPTPAEADRQRAIEDAARRMVDVFADGLGAHKDGPFCQLTDEGHAVIAEAREALERPVR